MVVIGWDSLISSEGEDISERPMSKNSLDGNVMHPKSRRCEQRLGTMEMTVKGSPLSLMAVTSAITRLIGNLLHKLR